MIVIKNSKITQKLLKSIDLITIKNTFIYVCKKRLKGIFLKILFIDNKSRK